MYNKSLNATPKLRVRLSALSGKTVGSIRGLGAR